MFITVQIVLIIAVLFTLFGLVGEKKDKELRQQLAIICTISTLCLFWSVMV